jgi:hypothetical protein
MAAKLTRLTHKIAIQLHLVAEKSIIRSYRTRKPVRQLLDAPSYDTCQAGYSVPRPGIETKVFTAAVPVFSKFTFKHFVSFNGHLSRFHIELTHTFCSLNPAISLCDNRCEHVNKEQCSTQNRYKLATSFQPG